MPTPAPLLRIIEVAWLAQLRPGDRILRIDDHRYRPELTVTQALTGLGEQPGDRGVRCRSADGAEVLVRPVECSQSLIIVREDPAAEDPAGEDPVGVHPAEEEPLTRGRALCTREEARRVSTAPERTTRRACTPDEHPGHRPGRTGGWSP